METSATTVWLNTVDYSLPQLTIFGLGCLGWVVVYMVVVRNILRYGFVEIPWPAVTANVAWEFVWSFVFDTDMGLLFTRGYQAWFFLDVFIVVGLYRYGSKQLLNPDAKPFFVPAATFSIVAWTIGLYFFRLEGYDTVTGATSGYVLNVMMSALYIAHFLAKSDSQVFSYLAAWSKFLGTGLISVFCFWYWPDKKLLLTLCVVAAILDIGYIVLFATRRASRASRS